MRKTLEGGIQLVTIHANGNRVSYGIKHLDLDTINDLKKINKSTLSPGSTIFIINTSKYYMLNGKKAWVEINPYGMGNSSNSGSGGSGGGGSGTDNDGIYDGGSIDGSDPTDDDIFNGGSLV